MRKLHLIWAVPVTWAFLGVCVIGCLVAVAFGQPAAWIERKFINAPEEQA